MSSGSTSAGSSRKRTAWSLASFVATTHAVRSARVERRTRSVWPFRQCFAVTMICGLSASTPEQPVVSTPTLALSSARRTPRSLPARAGRASSSTRTRVPPRYAIDAVRMTPTGGLLFAPRRPERDDVVEARVVDAPRATRLGHQDVGEACAPDDIARLVAVARVDGLGKALVVAHQRDHDLGLGGAERVGGRAAEGAPLGEGMDRGPAEREERAPRAEERQVVEAPHAVALTEK